MFRNDAQVNAVCRVLLEQLHVKGLGTDEGPTELALSHLEEDGGPLSRGERVLLLCAFAIWNGNEKVPFADVFNPSTTAPRRCGRFGLRALGRVTEVARGDHDTPNAA